MPRKFLPQKRLALVPPAKATNVVAAVATDSVAQSSNGLKILGLKHRFLPAIQIMDIIHPTCARAGMELLPQGPGI